MEWPRTSRQGAACRGPQRGLAISIEPRRRQTQPLRVARTTPRLSRRPARSRVQPRVGSMPLRRAHRRTRPRRAVRASWASLVEPIAARAQFRRRPVPLTLRFEALRPAQRAGCRRDPRVRGHASSPGPASHAGGCADRGLGWRGFRSGARRGPVVCVGPARRFRAGRPDRSSRTAHRDAPGNRAALDRGSGSRRRARQVQRVGWT
jgi:hypothetical protein